MGKICVEEFPVSLPQTPPRFAPCGDVEQGAQSGRWDFAPPKAGNLRQFEAGRQNPRVTMIGELQ